MVIHFIMDILILLCITFIILTIVYFSQKSIIEETTYVIKQNNFLSYAVIIFVIPIIEEGLMYIFDYHVWNVDTTSGFLISCTYFGLCHLSIYDLKTSNWTYALIKPCFSFVLRISILYYAGSSLYTRIILHGIDNLIGVYTDKLLTNYHLHGKFFNK